MGCPGCGFENPQGFRFCGGCGATLSDEAPDAERRLLTVMFCDLVGSSALSERFDPEDLRELLAGYHRLCAAVIEEFGGHVSQYLGDGVLTYFGFPEAHEDDPARAVHAALVLVKRVPQIETTELTEHGLRLSCRVGLHTGPVVAGEVGAGGRRERLALGQTPNIAARLESLAGENQVVMSGDTYRLVEGLFECEPLGERRLKGLAKPVQVYRALRASGARSRFEMQARSGLTPMVGRERELSELLGHFERAAAGRRVVVSVTGDAGIGKSRLLEAFRGRLPLADAHWLVARCSPYHRNTAFEPLADLLAREFGFERDATAEEKLEQLQNAFGSTELALLLGIAPRAGDPATRLAPKLRKQQSMQTFLDWLDLTRGSRPLVLVVEDLHWADPSTVELLTLLVADSRATACLTLFTSRPDFSAPWDASGETAGLALQRLESGEIEAMIDQVVGAGRLPPAVVTQLVERTDGIPFFVEELTRAVLENLPDESVDSFERSGSRTSMEVPTSLQGALMARLDRVPSGRDVAQLAATLGREFALEHLRAVSPLDDVTLDRTLAQLVEADLIEPRPGRPGCDHAFKHSLVQEIAYGSLLRIKRQDHHQRIARLLERRFPAVGDAEPELLALHWAGAHSPEKAASYYRQAADRAKSVYANEEAIAFYHAGLEHVVTVVDSGEAAGGDWHEMRSRICEDLGDVLVLTGQLDAAREAYSRSLNGMTEAVVRARLHRKTADTWETGHNREQALEFYRLAAAELGDHTVGHEVAWHHEWLQIRIGKIFVHYWMSEIEEMTRLVEKVRPVITRHGSPSQRSRFYTSLISSRMRIERFSISEETLSDARALLAASAEVEDPGELTISRFTAGLVLLLVNQLDEAEEHLGSALALTKQTGDMVLRTVCRTYVSLLHRRSGRVEETRQAATRSLELAQQYEMHEYVGTSQANLAWVAWRCDDSDGVERHGAEALEAWDRSPGVYSLCWTALLPRMALDLVRGDVTAALEHARLTLDPAQQQLPAELAGSLAAGIEAGDAGLDALARERLDAALQVAISSNYL